MKREKSLSRKVDVEEIEDIGELLLKEVDIEAEKKTSKVLPGVKKKRSRQPYTKMCKTAKM